MLLVKTKIGASKIHGIGLFADQFIPKDTVIWTFQEGFDLKFDKSEINILSKPALEQFLKYTYFDKRLNKYILSFDDSRFVNHSETPNCIGIYPADNKEGIDIAAWDIEIGEELTCDYREFDGDFIKKLSVK